MFPESRYETECFIFMLKVNLKNVSKVGLRWNNIWRRFLNKGLWICVKMFLDVFRARLLSAPIRPWQIGAVYWWLSSPFSLPIFNLTLYMDVSLFLKTPLPFTRRGQSYKVFCGKSIVAIIKIFQSVLTDSARFLNQSEHWKVLKLFFVKVLGSISTQQFACSVTTECDQFFYGNKRLKINAQDMPFCHLPFVTLKVIFWNMVTQRGIDT